MRCLMSFQGLLQGINIRQSNILETNMGVSLKKQQWDLRYYEASINLQEGENNDKFTIYPRDPSRHPAYKISHSTWFHVLNLSASLCLLVLTVFEPPSFSFLHLPVSVHGVLEITALVVIAAELALKFKWLGIKNFVTHRRTISKAVLLVIMMSEAVTLMVRQSSHLRVTRALRPLFLLDSFYCRNVRRFIRQLLQSLSAILNIFILLIFFMLIFAMLGFFLFSNNPKDANFQSLSDSFISLFILMTTANFPDVMMPSYKVTKWSSLFFVAYICTETFIFMNLFLAIVYSAFLKAEKDKFKKLYLHKRNGCRLAYRLLLSDQNLNGIFFEHFRGCLKYYMPHLSTKECYLIFKSLNASGTNMLSVEEFMNFYEHSKLKWKEERSVNEVTTSSCPMKLHTHLYKIVSSKWFDYAVYGVIFANFIWILSDSIRLSIRKFQSEELEYDWMTEEARFYWISVSFVLIYVVEVMLKAVGFGANRYLSDGWNVFDLLVTVAALLGVVLQLLDNNFVYVVVIRPLRVLRLFKLRRGFRNIFRSLFILVSRIFSLAMVMLLLYYFFAIVGMEVFAPYTQDLKNCCVNTSVQQFYAYSNESNVDGYYYLCTFENLISSGVTLFELTVVNNWWIIMEGYAHVVSPWTRIYFMVFYLITMVVMTVVVAFVLESYLFRERCEDVEERRIQKVLVTATAQELAEIEGTVNILQLSIDDYEPSSDVIHFEGIRKLKKSDFSMIMYSSEIQSWQAEPF